MKTYQELSKLSTFEDRFAYLKLNGEVGRETFGYDRWLNQHFYNSIEWRQLRNQIIVRDNGCDLGMPDRPILGHITIHHINPIRMEDIANASDKLLDPDNLVCVSNLTHQAIHYGDISLVNSTMIERTPNDTCPWRKT